MSCKGYIVDKAQSGMQNLQCSISIVWKEQKYIYSRSIVSRSQPVSAVVVRVSHRVKCERRRQKTGWLRETSRSMGITDVIGTPSLDFFDTLELVAFALVMALLLAATYTMLMMGSVLVLSQVKWTSGCEHGGCCRCMKTMFLFLGRMLCVRAFPALFKKHKTRTGNGSRTRVFMVFLDREVESCLPLVFAFCSIELSILCASSMLFFQHFPIVASGDCLEKDSHGRHLFCYSNSSNSRDPINCSVYSVSELRELYFQCYAISIFDLGIAVAAALAFAVAARKVISVYVLVTEGFFMMTKNPPQKLQECWSYIAPQWCCGCNYLTINRMYITFSRILLGTVAVITLSGGMTVLTELGKTKEKPLPFLHYVAYLCLPMLTFMPLGVILHCLPFQCEKGEYVSFAADQMPRDPRDCDVESGPSVTERRQDEARTDGERNSINETEQSQLIDTNSNTGYGAIRTEV